MRKKDETLRETLLDCAREIFHSEGPDAVNIRLIAQQAGVAPGTVYTYFSDKDEIMLLLTEEYWEKVLAELRWQIPKAPLVEQLEAIHSFLLGRIRSSAGHLMGSLRNVESAGKQRMHDVQQLLQEQIMELMEQDSKIREDIWQPPFTKEMYAAFVLRNMIMLLRPQAPDIAFFLELVKRTIY